MSVEEIQIWEQQSKTWKQCVLEMANLGQCDEEAERR